MSFGIIAMYFDDTSISEKNDILCSDKTHVTGLELIPKMRFLLIQRKDSLNFVEFVRGKYMPNDIGYIANILRNMTKAEHEKLLVLDFEGLWKSVWGKSNKSHRNDYEISLNKYNQIRNLIPELIRENPSQWQEPEWGFPKGRRNAMEKDLACAIREFEEETNILRGNFRILDNILPVSETFLGSNNVHYCHKYFLAVCDPSTKAEMSTYNHHMVREIGDIKWLTFEEALAKIRPDNIEKREILLNVVRIMRNYLPIGIGAAGF